MPLSLIHIFWTLSKVDPWVNLLRGSAQAFSAIMGGVDSIDVLPFDAAVRLSLIHI